MRLDAIVFDFDGSMVDTEWPSYRAYAEHFEERGHELALERWITLVGTHDAEYDPIEELLGLTGEDLDPGALRAACDRRFHDLADEEGPRPGVVELMDAAEAAGVALGVASSSRHAWVAHHLDRLGLSDRVHAVVGRDDVGMRGKPAPDVYLRAVELLGARPSCTVAVEDSAHGVRSALAAGLTAVAVPNRITRGMDFDGAVLTVDSLAEVTLDTLAELVAERRTA